MDRHTIGMASKMYECRDSARFLLGDKFPDRMKEWGEAIKSVAKAKGCTEIEALNAVGKQTEGFPTICLIAAYVEMVEPSPPAPSSISASQIIDHGVEQGTPGVLAGPSGRHPQGG